MDPSLIPAEIQEGARAVLWNYEQREGRATKVPYSPTHPGRHAAVDNPETWGTFHQALAAVEDGKADGIGHVLGDGLIGIDIDGCRDPETGAITTEAVDIIAAINSYTEVSPSRCGIHILVRGVLPPGGRRKGSIEMYADGRYFTVSGTHVEGTPRTIEHRPAELAELHARVFAPLPAPAASRSTPYRTIWSPSMLDDVDLLNRAGGARNGSKFQSLMAGDTSAHGSASEADQALCNMLAFWTNHDAARMDRLFRQSGLMREKWDQRRGASTYGAITIAKAIADCRDVYTGDRPLEMPRGSGVHQDQWAERDISEFVEEPEPPYAVVTPPLSFISRYVAYAQKRTDAPAVSHELFAVAMLSALAGPNTRLMIGTTPKGWRLTIWGMYIVNSTMGRKTTVIDLAIDILDAVLGTTALIPWEGSPQGLIQRLQQRDHHTSVFVRDEYSGLLKQMNRGGHMAGLEQTFIRAFDGNRIENMRTRKRSRGGEFQDDTDRVENPYLVKMTAAAFDAFTIGASIDNVLDGFLARFIFVTGESEPRELPQVDPTLVHLREQLLACARSFQRRAEQTPEIAVEPDVLRAHFDVVKAWQREALHTTRPDAAKPALNRLADSVLKVAALLALDDDAVSPPTVTRSHFETARQLAQRWKVSTLKVIDALGRSEFARHAEAVRETIKHQPGISVSTLYRRHRNFRKRDFDEILVALETQSEVSRVTKNSDGGRPSVCFYPVRGKEV